MGPLLFALYINDLPSLVNYSTLDLYTDNAKLYFSHLDLSVVEVQVQLDLNAVLQWISIVLILCLSVVKLVYC